AAPQLTEHLVAGQGEPFPRLPARRPADGRAAGGAAGERGRVGRRVGDVRVPFVSAEAGEAFSHARLILEIPGPRRPAGRAFPFGFSWQAGRLRWRLPRRRTLVDVLDLMTGQYPRLGMRHRPRPGTRVTCRAGDRGEGP